MKPYVLLAKWGLLLPTTLAKMTNNPVIVALGVIINVFWLLPAGVIVILPFIVLIMADLVADEDQP